MDTQGLKVEFGKHFGKLYTEVPSLYLKWMLMVHHPSVDIAKAELARRETVRPSNKIDAVN